MRCEKIQNFFDELKNEQPCCCCVGGINFVELEEEEKDNEQREAD